MSTDPPDKLSRERIGVCHATAEVFQSALSLSASSLPSSHGSALRPRVLLPLKNRRKCTGIFANPRARDPSPWWSMAPRPPWRTRVCRKWRNFCSRESIPPRKYARRSRRKVFLSFIPIRYIPETGARRTKGAYDWLSAKEEVARAVDVTQCPLYRTGTLVFSAKLSTLAPSRTLAVSEFTLTLSPRRGYISPHSTWRFP